MSDVEAYRGKLVPVDLEGMTIEEKCQQLCSATERESYNDTWLEQLEDEFYKEYFYDAVNQRLFAVKKEEFDPEELMIMSKNDDGSYEFMTSFYNGGTNLKEMLTDGIAEVEED